jgi:hypothetical protein
MTDHTVPGIDIPANPHPGAGSDPSDFYGFFEGGVTIDAGAYDALVEEVVVVAQRGPTGSANLNLNLNLDLNKAFADLGKMLQSKADFREQAPGWFFDVDEILITVPAGSGDPIGGPNGSISMELFQVSYMKNGSVWVDTDHDNIPDLYVKKNAAGEWWADTNMDRNPDMFVGRGDFFEF